MKAILKFTTVITLLFVTVSGFAKEPKAHLLVNKETKSLIFKMNNSEKTSIILKDEQGNVIYSERVSDLAYVKKFNLANLSDGVYYFTTENRLKATVYTIDVTDAEVKIIEKKETTKPFFRRTKGKVYMNFLNLSNEDVSVKVLDGNSRSVFEKTYSDKTEISEAFNFVKAYSGVYTIVVKDSNNTFYESIVVN